MLAAFIITLSFILGKKREEIEDFLNSGVFQVQRLKEEGWITNIMYDDEVQTSFLWDYDTLSLCKLR